MGGEGGANFNVSLRHTLNIVQTLEKSNERTNMDMMTDIRDFKSGDTEFLKDKLLSRKDNSVWQIIY